MTNTATDGAFEYIHTFWDKVLSRLGYRMNHEDEPPTLDPKKHVGRMHTVAEFSFRWPDRLRLLLTGRLKVEITHYTTQQIDESVNSVSYRIFAPGEQSASYP